MRVTSSPAGIWPHRHVGITCITFAGTSRSSVMCDAPLQQLFISAVVHARPLHSANYCHCHSARHCSPTEIDLLFTPQIPYRMPTMHKPSQASSLPAEPGCANGHHPPVSMARLALPRSMPQPPSSHQSIPSPAADWQWNQALSTPATELHQRAAALAASLCLHPATTYQATGMQTRYTKLPRSSVRYFCATGIPRAGACCEGYETVCCEPPAGADGDG